MFDLPDKITVWNETGNDGFGGKTWSSPAIFDSMNSTRQEKFTDTNGDQLLSVGSTYMVGDGLKIGSSVLFGESVDATPPRESNDVRQLSQAPSISPVRYKKAWFA